MRRLLVLGVLLVVLAYVADRVTVRVAQDQLATRLQTAADLPTRPTVQLRGFPFLTQAINGDYREIDVTATDFARGGVRLSSLQAKIRGLRLPLSQIIGGTITTVDVDSLSARVVVAYADLARRSGLLSMTISPSGSHVLVTARLSVLGQSVSATATSELRLVNGIIVMTARSLRVLGQTTPGLVNALTGRLDLRVPVGTLPYNLELTGLQVTPGGVVLSAGTGRTAISLR